ncbi:MAG: Rid family detoxifying hydrolase [Bryobacteraceae bacterium]
MNQFEPVTVPELPPVNPTYSQAACFGDLILVSGQLGIDPATRALVDGGVAAQTRQALENLSMILKSAGSSLEKVGKVNIYMVNMGELAAMNEVYRTYFTANRPAKTTVQVSGLDKGALIEIEAVAAVGRP